MPLFPSLRRFLPSRTLSRIAIGGVFLLASCAPDGEGDGGKSDLQDDEQGDRYEDGLPPSDEGSEDTPASLDPEELGILVELLAGQIIDDADTRLPSSRFKLPGDLPADTLLVDIGPLNVAAGLSQEVRFTIPEEVSSLVFVGLGPSGTLTGLHYFGLPLQPAIVSDFIRSFDDDVNRSFTVGENGITLIPNSPEVVGLQAGAYSLKFASYIDQGGGQIVPSSQPIYAYALARTSTPTPAGVLDLNLIFSGSDGLTASSAQSSSAVQTAVQAMRTYYSEVGITLRSIEYHDAPASVTSGTVSLGSSCGDYSAIGNVAALSTEGRRRALNIVFVEGFTCASGGGVGGLSLGVPGLPRVNGLMNSAVAVSTQVLISDPAYGGTALAHEAGHFLGLFHTVESTGVTDTIADTPAPGSSAVENNLMYYAPFESELGLSPGQGFVMRNNPLITRTDAAGEPIR